MFMTDSRFSLIMGFQMSMKWKAAIYRHKILRCREWFFDEQHAIDRAHTCVQTRACHISIQMFNVRACKKKCKTNNLKSLITHDLQSKQGSSFGKLIEFVCDKESTVECLPRSWSVTTPSRKFKPKQTFGNMYNSSTISKRHLTLMSKCT